VGNYDPDSGLENSYAFIECSHDVEFAPSQQDYSGIKEKNGFFKKLSE